MKLSDIHLTLLKIRKENGLSQQDIADTLNVEQATISMYENGKRGIPLDLLDEWLKLLNIEVTITPKGFEPIKPAKDTEDALLKFNELKKKRNYLTAELRAMMAEKVLQEPAFLRIDEESGENAFWPYAFYSDDYIGLVETRYDHPEQKYLAVEYTKSEVNVYRFLSGHETKDGKGDADLHNITRIYFSEDDFLTASAQWDQDELDMCKMTILRKGNVHTDGVEIIDPEGFSLRSLVEMMENFKCFSESVKDLEEDWKYISMEQELETIGDEMLDIVLNNRLANGSSNPDFVFWTSEDLDVIDVPLAEIPRAWSWVEKGVSWTETTKDTVTQSG